MSVAVEPVADRRRRQLVLLSMMREYADQAGYEDVVADSERLAGRLLGDLAAAEGAEEPGDGQ